MATNAHKTTSTFIDNNLAAIGVEDESLVLAWAKDVATGAPIYILQLGKDRQGAKSNCICMGCEEPLQAVNAAKVVGTYKKRPHFRHHVGVQTDSCAVLTARALALQQLKELGVIELPRRRRSANAVGLSGTDYQAWVELPIERSFVRHFSFVDSMRGVVTLEDGREVDVVLVGSVAEAEAADTSQVLRPEIRIVVEGDEFSGLDPAQLQETLRMRIKEGFWCSHWKDVELALQAAEEAKRKRKEALDWLDDGVQFPEGTTDAEKRETLLHALAKQILEREKFMIAPEILSEAEMKSCGLSPGDYRSKCKKSIELIFERVELELNTSGLRPDVIGYIAGNSPVHSNKVHIEITVKNEIKGERLQKIIKLGIPTVEVSLASLGGHITQNGFEKILINQTDFKRWIHLSHTVIDRLPDSNKNTVIIIDEDHYRAIYLQTITDYGNQTGLANTNNSAEVDVSLRFRIIQAAKPLKYLGYEEADYYYAYERNGLVCRVLSIKNNCAVWRDLRVFWSVINTILQDENSLKKYHYLYLIAIKIWCPGFNAEQEKIVREWRANVKLGMEYGNAMYKPDKTYNNLLGFLFPEMKSALSAPLPWKPRLPLVSSKQYSYADLRSKSFASTFHEPSIDRLTENDLLKGREYEEWKRGNPEAAAVWENAQKNKPAN